MKFWRKYDAFVILSFFVFNGILAIAGIWITQWEWWALSFVLLVFGSIKWEQGRIHDSKWAMGPTHTPALICRMNHAP
jgi:hypothetical protein